MTTSLWRAAGAPENRNMPHQRERCTIRVARQYAHRPAWRTGRECEHFLTLAQGWCFRASRLIYTILR